MRIRPIRSEHEVSDFLDSCSFETTAFNRLDIIQTLVMAFNRHLLVLGMYEGAALEGVALLIVQRKGPLGIVQRLPIRYGGIVASPEHIPECLVQMRPLLASLGVGKAYYSFSPWSPPDKEQLREAGFVVEDVPTMLLPVDADNVMSGADRRVRESIRKAVRQHVRVRPSTEGEIRVQLPRFLEQTYGRRHLKSPYPKGAGDTIWERHNGLVDVHMATAEQDGVALGIMVTVAHKGRAYSWLIARDYTRCVNLNVNAMLVFDAAEWSAQVGATELDLGGGTPGIREFKRRLGADELTHIEVHATHPLYAPVFRLREVSKLHR